MKYTLRLGYLRDNNKEPYYIRVDCTDLRQPIFIWFKRSLDTPYFRSVDHADIEYVKQLLELDDSFLDLHLKISTRGELESDDNIHRCISITTL